MNKTLTDLTLGELLGSDNDIIYRNANGILKELKRQQKELEKEQDKELKK